MFGRTIRRVRGAMALSNQGLTLIELLIAIVILVVLASVAVPSFQGYMANQRILSQQETLLNGVAIARETAAQVSRHISICPTETGQRCHHSNDWSMGWLIFQDLDANQQLGQGESILFAHVNSEQKITINANTTVLTFSPNGFSSQAEFILCSRIANTTSRTLELNTLGTITKGYLNDDSCGL